MRAVVALCLLFLSAPVAAADQPIPIENVDGFEATLRRCFSTNPEPATCFDGMRNHFPRENDKLDPVVGQVRDLFQRWLGKDKIFAVHAVKTTKLGSYLEQRVYLVESTSGNVMMLNVSFVHSLGSWYLQKINLTSKSDEIRSVLGDLF